MTIDPATVRLIVTITALLSFLLFLICVYIPRLRNESTVVADFFRNTTSILETLTFSFLYIALFGMLFAAPESMLSPTWAPVGGVLSIFGLGIALMARLSLSKNWRPVTDARAPATLHTTGIFRYVRHPIYTARLLFFVGVMLLFASPLLVLSIPYWYLLRQKARSEEAMLHTSFPEYHSYRNSTFSPF